MNSSTIWTIKYMNRSIVLKARYINWVGFEMLAQTPVPKVPPSYNTTLLCIQAVPNRSRIFSYSHRRLYLFGQRQAKKCFQTCTDLAHPVHAQSIVWVYVLNSYIL